MSDIVLSVCVLTVPDRSERLPALLDGMAVPDANLDVVLDDELRSPWVSGQLAWQRRRPDSTHHLVIEDDALVCADFYEGVMAILRAVPRDPVMLYATTPPGAGDAYWSAIEEGKHWVRTRGFWTVAPVLPVDLIDPIFNWAHEHTRSDWEDAHDKRLSIAAQVLGFQSMVAVPSPVSHDWSIPSSRGHDHMRDVWQPIPALGAASALGIDWNLGARDPVIDEGLDSITLYRSWIL